MEIGTKIKTKGLHHGLEGIVTFFRVGYDCEDHGHIDIEVTANNRPEFWSWVKVGDTETFVYFNHEQDLEEI